jgi:hypothetical protein
MRRGMEEGNGERGRGMADAEADAGSARRV